MASRTVRSNWIGFPGFIAFGTNMAFISLNYLRGSIDYEAGFYLAYIMGSVTFPVTSILVESAQGIRRARARRRQPSE